MDGEYVREGSWEAGYVRGTFLFDATVLRAEDVPAARGSVSIAHTNVDTATTVRCW